MRAGDPGGKSGSRAGEWKRDARAILAGTDFQSVLGLQAAQGMAVLRREGGKEGLQGSTPVGAATGQQIGGGTAVDQSVNSSHQRQQGLNATAAHVLDPGFPMRVALHHQQTDAEEAVASSLLSEEPTARTNPPRASKRINHERENNLVLGRKPTLRQGFSARS